MWLPPLLLWLLVSLLGQMTRDSSVLTFLVTLSKKLQAARLQLPRLLQSTQSLARVVLLQLLQPLLLAQWLAPAVLLLWQPASIIFGSRFDQTRADEFPYQPPSSLPQHPDPVDPAWPLPLPLWLPVSHWKDDPGFRCSNLFAARTLPPTKLPVVLLRSQPQLPLTQCLDPEALRLWLPVSS